MVSDRRQISAGSGPQAEGMEHSVIDRRSTSEVGIQCIQLQGSKLQVQSLELRMNGSHRSRLTALTLAFSALNDLNDFNGCTEA
jgi:hypothetical protein